MCFSPTGDLAAGTVIVAIGVDACRHLEGRKEFVAFAALPVVFGLHQIDESLVWFALQGHVASSIGRVAMWIYLIFALGVLPVAVPLMTMAIATTRRRRRAMVPVLALGGVVTGVLADAMVRAEPHVRLGHYHLAYTIGLHDGVLWIGLYILATCGPLLLSGVRFAVWFGVLNVVAVVVLARLCADGFTSLWCAYAAVVSACIAMHLRTSGDRYDDRSRAKRTNQTVVSAGGVS